MSSFALTLVLASAVLHASWNLWAKQLGSSARATTTMWLLESLSTLAYLPVAAVAWRAAPAPIDATGFAWIAGSALLHIAYFVLLLRGYRLSDLSVVYPVARGTGPLLAAAGAAIWLGEHPTPASVAGALSIATGIAILTLRPGLRRAHHLRAGLLYGLLVGVTIGAYTLWDGSAVSRRGLPPILYYWGGELCRVLIFTPFVAADRAGVRALWRAHRARVLGIALASPLAYILVLVALTRARVSHVAPVRELSILLGAWLGSRALGEGDRLRRWLAAIAFAAGVTALAFA